MTGPAWPQRSIACQIPGFYLSAQGCLCSAREELGLGRSMRERDCARQGPRAEPLRTQRIEKTDKKRKLAGRPAQGGRRWTGTCVSSKSLLQHNAAIKPQNQNHQFGISILIVAQGTAAVNAEQEPERRSERSSREAKPSNTTRSRTTTARTQRDISAPHSPHGCASRAPRRPRSPARSRAAFLVEKLYLAPEALLALLQLRELLLEHVELVLRDSDRGLRARGGGGTLVDLWVRQGQLSAIVRRTLAPTFLCRAHGAREP